MSTPMPAPTAAHAPPPRPVPIPGPRPLPLVGNLLDLIGADQETSVDFADDMHREHGPAFALRLGGERQIFASSHALVAQMCSSPLWSKSVHATLEQIRDFAGDGLFTAHNDEPSWSLAHRLLMPAFGAVAMTDHVPDMVDVADQMLTRWERFGPGARIDVADDMTRLTLDTIGLCGFGVRFNSFYSADLHPFVGAMVRSLVEAGERADRLPGLQPFLLRANRRYREDIATMHRIAQELVDARVATPPDERPHDLLERMLTTADPVTGERLSERNVRYQLATFLIAGHETTSGLLSFATHRLLTRPDVLARARETVDQVLGERDPTAADLPGLGYLGQILRETLRLHPTAPAFALAPSEDTRLGEHAIGAGESVLVMLHTLHRDPAVWPDPERFDPDRFAPERMAEIPAYAWMPFGHGARACIGRPFALQEATIVLAMMLQRFDLALADPAYELRVQETLTIKPRDLQIRATRRRPAPAAQAHRGAGAPARPAAPGASSGSPVAPAHGTPLHVLFGSDGGTSESLARTIAGDGRARGWSSVVGPLDERAGDLPTDGPLVVVTSSYNGAPPHNARRFVEWLTTASPDLSGVEYLVLGVGSLDWAATYQRVPTLIDEALAAAGATRLRARGATDARTDFFGDWERWYEPLWPELADARGIVDVAPREARFRVADAPGADERGDVTATVLENRELVRRGGQGSKRHLELRLPPGVAYRTGDYLSVLPHNHPDLVARLLDRLGLRAAQYVTVESPAPAGRIPLGRATRLDDLLARAVDLAAPATPGAVARLARTTACPPERAELERLAGPDHADQVLGGRLGVLDLLERYASCQVDLALVLDLLPAPLPRLYSISSAAEESETAALTVSVVEGPARSGRGDVHGTASGHLARLLPGDPVTVSVASPADGFRPPADNATPVVLIAAGSGIAPFRGFVRARLARARAGEPLGPTVLFFGCRHPDHDDLYADELAQHEAAGRVEVHRAYSRLPDGDVRHVQHALWRHRERVLDLTRAGAHVYVCGDATGMGPAVEQTLRDIGTLAPIDAVGPGAAPATGAAIGTGAADGTDGGPAGGPGDRGERWLDALRAAGRYATDVY
ncbi:bifunctional cytochrome P450/NADPH--P450 reductase [Oerskovia turbata]